MALIYKDYQDQIQLVNSNMVGIKERNNCNPPGTSSTDFHPAAKNDWGIIDRIRGCLGRYKTVYRSSGYAYHNLSAELLINYSGYINSNAQGANLNTGAHDTDIGRLRQQLQNIVIDYSIYPDDPANLSATVAAPTGIWETMKITANNANWNAWQNRAPESDDWVIANGQWDPFTQWSQFAGYGLWVDPAGAGLYSGLSRGINQTDWGTFQGPLQDHTSVFYGPPRPLETREKSGLLFDPSPTYNFYVQTAVSYEGVIANSQIKEWHLPNAYYLQHELKNTSSALLAPYHLDAITLGQNIDYFNVTNAQTVTEANTRSYYNMYTDGLQDLLFDSVEFDTMNSKLEVKNKNFVILHSDLDALGKKAIHLSTIPFYNTIAMGAYQDQITGYADNRSILNALWDDKDTRDAIDLLQLLAIRRLTTASGAVVSGSFTVTKKRAEASSRTRSNGEHMPSYNTDLQEQTPVLFDLRVEMEGLQNMGGQPAVELSSLINANSRLAAAPYKFIRNYDREDLNVDPQSISRAWIRMFESTPEGDRANVQAVTRPLEKVYNNASCHTETLLYVIHKRKVNLNANGDPVTGPVIQTFYISPRLHSSLPAYLYDSQVKYNQRYQYDVSKVVLVFGNSYSYGTGHNNGQTPEQMENSPNTYPSGDTNSTDPMGLNWRSYRVRNDHDIKAIVVPHVLGGLDAAPIIDKPPREPEISFYAYKGINDKLLILLAAATGRTVQSPVKILEGDKQYFEEEYFSQSGVELTFDEIKTQDKKIIFKSDDPVDRYQLFKLSRPPKSYETFSDSILPEVDPDFGVAGALVDNIQPNIKYYYCARAIDVHENVSNPTHIFEIEMVDNNGQIFLKQKVFSFEKSEENLVKSGRRFIYIEPALQQAVLDQGGWGSALGVPSLTVAPPTALLGANGVMDQVWGKGFKVRLTSKQTGRKLDLNINFTNTGKVKPSE